LHRRIELRCIANIAAQVLNHAANFGVSKKVGLGPRIQRIAAHHGPLMREPQRQPATFESGMARSEKLADLANQHSHPSIASNYL
jgi:hypothetical protein